VVFFCPFLQCLSLECTDCASGDEAALLQVSTQSAILEKKKKSSLHTYSEDLGRSSTNSSGQNLPGPGKIEPLFPFWNQAQYSSQCPVWVWAGGERAMKCNGYAVMGTVFHHVTAVQFLTCPYQGSMAQHLMDLSKPDALNTGCGWGASWPSVPVILVEVVMILAIFLMCKYLCDARMWKWREQAAAAQIVSSRFEVEECMESEPRLLHAKFTRHAAATPSATALIYGDKGQHRMSYKELQDAALQTAFLLVDKHKVKPCTRTPIGISAEGENFYKAALGVVQTGNPYVPLTTAWPVMQLEFILKDANIPVVLVDEDALTHSVWSRYRGEKKEAENITVEVLNIKEAEQITVRTPSWTVKENDLAYILYTSGSTGHPKGVLAPHRCYYSRMKWMWSSLPIKAGEVGIHKTVPIWVDHIQEVFGYLGGGIPVVIASPAARKNPDMLNTLCRDNKVSRIVVVPSLLRLFMAMHGGRLGQELPNLRTWITSGEPLTTETLRTFLSSSPGAKIINTYGSTEVAGDVTWAAYDSNSDLKLELPGEFVPIGKPMQGVKLHILNPETLQPVEASEVGELVVEGDFVTEGYLNRPEEQNKSYIAIPHLTPPVARAFRTGDFGRIGAGGNIEYHGRQDQQVKVHGQRVEVLHVEQVLKNALQNCLEKAGKVDAMCPFGVIMAVKSQVDTGSYDLHAFIETGDSDAIARIKIEEVKERMQKELMPAHVPESFWKQPLLPRLPNSKLDRTALKKLAEKLKEETAQTQEFSKEVDSFGTMRQIAVGYRDSRRALHICTVWCLWHVVTMHGLAFWLAAGVLPNVPDWLRVAEGYWDAMEDVWMLMATVACVHGMGGEEKNKIGLLEPGVLGMWAFSTYILPHIIDFVGRIFTGIPLYQCSAIPGSALFFCPTTGHLYFLLYLFWARMMVVTWHFAVTSRFSKDVEPLLNGVLCGLSTLVAAFGWFYPVPVPQLHEVFLPMSGKNVGCSHLYMTLYLFCFYFGYKMLPKRESIKGHWQVVCPLLFLAYIFGQYILTQLLIFPAFDQRSNNLQHIVGYFAQALPFGCLYLCFLKLPAEFDIKITGLGLMCIYVLHEELKNLWLQGIRIHGLKVFPSLPDLVHSAGAVFATTNAQIESSALTSLVTGMLQLIVIIVYHLGMFTLIPYILVPFSFIFERILDLCRPLVGRYKELLS
jgi:amino acid adenylation domain-containing protein